MSICMPVGRSTGYSSPAMVNATTVNTCALHCLVFICSQLGSFISHLVFRTQYLPLRTLHLVSRTSQGVIFLQYLQHETANPQYYTRICIRYKTCWQIRVLKRPRYQEIPLLYDEHYDIPRDAISIRRYLGWKRCELCRIC